jgi:hypothetical protein
MFCLRNEAGLVDEKKIERFSKFTNLPVERLTIALDHFLNRIQSI